MGNVKTLAMIAIVGVLSGGIANAAVEVKKTRHMARYEFSIDGVDVKDIFEDGLPANSQTIYLKGIDGYVTKAKKVGEPEIPVIRFYVEAKGDIEAVGEFGKASSAFNKVKVSGIIKPAQPPRVKKPGVVQDYVINEEIYNSNVCYGEDKLIYVDKAGSVKGWDKHIITVFPMCYNPADQELVWRKYIRIRVTGDLKPNVDEDQQTVNEAVAFVVGEQFVDSEALKRYVTYKENNGYIVKTIPVGEKFKTPEDIRKEIQRLYNSESFDLKHVLIVGDSGDVPAKRAKHIYGVTDHFYRAIDTDNYEKDINGPDISVGRFSVSTEEQLAAVVDKNIRYQAGSFESEEWLNRVSFIGTNDYAHWELAEGTHNHVIEKHMKDNKYMGTYPDSEQLGGDTLYYMTHKARNADVMKAIKQGRTIVNYSGHGATTFWDAPRMSQADVRSIENTSSLPFVISNACITSQFTIKESFGETWQRHPYGSIVFWGSMDSTYWDEDDVLEKQMYDGIFELNNRSFKDITQYALGQHWLHYGGGGLSKYYWETYVMLGDPAIELRMEKAQKIKLHGPAEVSVDRDTLFYMVTDDEGRPVSGVRVSLRLKGGDLVIASKSNEHGLAKFDLRNLHRGPATFTIAATAANTTLFNSEIHIKE